MSTTSFLSRCGALAAAALLGGAALAQPVQPPRPSSPVTLNVVDVAGDLALTQTAIEAYKAQHPTVVEKITFTKAPAPELPAKIKAMQAAGRADIDLVLTGTDALAAGIEQKLWVKLLPDHEKDFPGILGSYVPAARKMQDLAQGQGLVVAFMPAGPLLEFDPAKVKTPPTTPQELLAWCKANPNKLIYARPRNSGPGRTFLMGLPYLLGDKDPRDPLKGWDKTWTFLRELSTCVEYYPSGTGAVMKELGEGSRDMTVTVTGWDINPRALGTVPPTMKVAAFKGMVWVNDAHYMVVPRGVSAEKLEVLKDLMRFLLEPRQQALTYDKGYFFPGPAVKNVPVAMASAESQAVLKEFGRPEYDQWLAQFPHATPLDARPMVDAFARWDAEIGAQKVQ